MTRHEIYLPERRQARLLQALALFSSCLMMLLGVLVFEAVGEARECLDDRDCTQGHVCLESACTPIIKSIRPRRCKVGYLCTDDSETCEGLVCKNGILRRADLGPQVCEDKSVREFFASIEAKCDNSNECTQAEFKKLLIASEDFNRLLREFETSFALHFDSGQPSRRARQGKSPRWNTTRAHYIDQLVPLMRTLEGASSVILVGTASAQAGNNKNDEIGLRRLQEARYLLNQAAKEAGITADTLSLKETNVGDEWQHDNTSYSDLSLSRSILWDSKREQLFADYLEDFEAATTGLSSRRQKRQRKWRDDVLNQAVFVIPNPCTAPSTTNTH